MPAVTRVAARAPLRTVRPRDLQDVAANPYSTLRRLVANGELLRLTHGYFVAIPDDAPQGWQPTLEAAGLGIAAAIFGHRQAILMGLSAARVLHALPRAINVTIVAVPSQHRPISLEHGGRITFVKRNPDALDAQLIRLDTGQGLVTTPEQTVLDLAKRPGLGGLPAEADQAIINLLPTANLDLIDDLAAKQHAPTAMKRVRAMADQ